MKNRRSNCFRNLAVPTLILISLTLWNLFPIRSSNQTAIAGVLPSRTQFAVAAPYSSSQTAQTANPPTLTKPAAQSASRLMSNGKIAFARGTQDSYLGIYTMNPDGSDLRRLTSGDDIEPAWSADGAQIAFTRFYGATQGEIL